MKETESQGKIQKLSYDCNGVSYFARLVIGLGTRRYNLTLILFDTGTHSKIFNSKQLRKGK
jgi:hypothetical protein